MRQDQPSRTRARCEHPTRTPLRGVGMAGSTGGLWPTGAGAMRGCGGTPPRRPARERGPKLNASGLSGHLLDRHESNADIVGWKLGSNDAHRWRGTPPTRDGPSDHNLRLTASRRQANPEQLCNNDCSHQLQPHNQAAPYQPTARTPAARALPMRHLHGTRTRPHGSACACAPPIHLSRCMGRQGRALAPPLARLVTKRASMARRRHARARARNAC